MKESDLSDNHRAYINVYKNPRTNRVTLSRRYHASLVDAVTAAEGTCATGSRRCVARIRVEWYEGQFDD
jgi:hypothetical protein